MGTDPEQTIKSFTVELWCEDDSTPTPTATPTAMPTNSPIAPVPDGITGTVRADVTVGAIERSFQFLTPYSGSASAYIIAYEGCLEYKGDTPKSSNCQIFPLAPQGETSREAYNDVRFDGLTYVWVASEAWPEGTSRTALIENRDYIFYIRAVNNYGSYAATAIEAAFDTRQTGRRLNSIFNNSTSVRNLHQNDDLPGQSVFTYSDVTTGAEICGLQELECCRFTLEAVCGNAATPAAAADAVECCTDTAEPTLSPTASPTESP